MVTSIILSERTVLVGSAWSNHYCSSLIGFLMEEPRKMGPPKEMRRPWREVVGNFIITMGTAKMGSHNPKLGEQSA